MIKKYMLLSCFTLLIFSLIPVGNSYEVVRSIGGRVPNSGDCIIKNGATCSYYEDLDQYGCPLGNSILEYHGSGLTSEVSLGVKVNGALKQNQVAGSQSNPDTVAPLSVEVEVPKGSNTIEVMTQIKMTDNTIKSSSYSITDKVVSNPNANCNPPSTPKTDTSSSSSSQCESTMNSQQALQECTKGTQGYYNNHIMNCNSCVGSTCHWSAGPTCGSSGGGGAAGCGSAANAGPSCQGNVPTPGQEDTPAPVYNEMATRGPPQVKLATTSTTLDSNLLAIASACQDGNAQSLNSLGRQQLGFDFDISTKALIFNA